MYTNNEIQDYGTSLYQHRAFSVKAARGQISFNDWQPEKKKCHDNVSNYCARQQGCKPIRGWLYLDYGNENEVSLALSMNMPYVDFLAHSIVQLSSGKLCDITPAEKFAGNYPFIMALETNEKFLSHIANTHIHTLRYDLLSSVVSINPTKT